VRRHDEEIHTGADCDDAARGRDQRSENSIDLSDYVARIDSYIEYGGGGSGGGRMYDPLIGRFLSADTIVPGPSNPQALNRYSYGFNSPLKYTDPDGHCPMPSAEVGGGGIICFASFIPTPTAQGPGGAIFKGDDRGFGPIWNSNSNSIHTRTWAISFAKQAIRQQHISAANRNFVKCSC
jgi:RHS repeat-associated protein